jgi:hypothetical protein
MKKLLFLFAALLMLSVPAKSQTVISGGAVWVDPSGYLFYLPMRGSARMAAGTSQVGASITAGTAAIAATDTKILSSPVMPANRLVAGTAIRVTVIGTDTSTAAAAPVLVLRYGTAGTTSDDTLAIVTFANAPTSGNGIPFKITLDVTVRTSGASGTAYGVGSIVNQGTTGISSTATQVVLATTKALNTITASTYLTASLTSGNSGNLIHVHEATIEFPVK